MVLANVSLPPDLVEFVRTKMSTGDYSSENEVVCEALAFLRERDVARAVRLKNLRREIQLGLDALDRGESKPFDADEIKAEVRRRLAGGNATG
jgi:antitoxin ParD1/3/4